MKPDMTPGTHAYYVEVKAEKQMVAEIKAAKHRVVKTLSWFWMISEEIEPGLWRVKVAYTVD